MPWQLDRRDEGWSVVSDEGVVAGSHDSRADAIKHQRALYAREAMVASMYEQLDAQPENDYKVVSAVKAVTADGTFSSSTSSLSPLAAELVGLLLRDEREKSLVASMADSQAEIVRQNQEAREERHALVAALSRMGSPVINLPEPVVNVSVPQAQVDVHVPAAEVTVNTPDVKVEVASPNVTVRPEIVMPSVQKTVTFERDPLTQQVTRAEVTET